MASALSFTAWIVSWTSVLVTPRIASRSLMSSRPISSWLLAMASLLGALTGAGPGGSGSGRCRGAERGHEVGADEAGDGGLVGERDRRRGVEGVGQEDPHDELGAVGGPLGVPDEALEVGGGERGGHLEGARQAVEGEGRQDPLGLVGEEEAQRLVVRQEAGRRGDADGEE